MNVRSPEDINANAKVTMGVLYRGVETGPDATQALRYFKGGDLGDGIYLTAWKELAASYGGGPKASVRSGTRVVYAYQVTPLFPEDVVYLFGGLRRREPVRLVSGNGIELWEGPWVSSEIEAALRQHGGKVVIGTPDSIGINQVAVRDRSILKPEMPFTEGGQHRLSRGIWTKPQVT
jgi:hypothetical protein